MTATPDPTPTPTPSPSDVAIQAGQRMLQINSLHFVIELSGKLTYLDDRATLALKRAEGDVERPDRMRAIVTMSTLGISSEVAIIGIGDDQYATNPFNQEWEALPEGYGWHFDPAVLFDPDYGIEAILRSSDWRFGETEEIEGQEHHHLQGTLPGERLQLLTSGLISSGEVEVEIWTGREDALVRRIHVVETESDPDTPSEWLITFATFDEPVGIEPPPIP